MLLAIDIVGFLNYIVLCVQDTISISLRTRATVSNNTKHGYFD